MAFARPLAKGDRVERTRLRKAANEACYGFQFTTNNIGEGVAAARIAAEAGARFVDLNCGERGGSGGWRDAWVCG